MNSISIRDIVLNKKPVISVWDLSRHSVCPYKRNLPLPLIQYDISIRMFSWKKIKTYNIKFIGTPQIIKDETPLSLNQQSSCLSDVKDDNSLIQHNDQIQLKNRSFLNQQNDIKPCHLPDIEEGHVIPLIKFYKKGKLSVTDFSSQLWCEKQMEFTLITGKKRVTPSMKSGTSRHEILERADHETIDIEVTTREDALGLRFLNSIILLKQLQACGKAREIWVFGIIDDIVIRGVIDEIEIQFAESEDCFNVVLSDTKTRSSATLPSDAQQRTSGIQVQLYQWMIHELKNGDINFTKLFELYNCNPNHSFTVEPLQTYQNLNQLSIEFKKQFESLPALSNCSEIIYEYQSKEFARSKVPYSKISTLYTVQDLLDWWKGLRMSEPVLLSEKWKCRYCDFLKECTSTPIQPEVVNDILLAREANKKCTDLEDTEHHSIETLQPFNETIQEDMIDETQNYKEEINNLNDIIKQKTQNEIVSNINHISQLDTNPQHIKDTMSVNTENVSVLDIPKKYSCVPAIINADDSQQQSTIHIVNHTRIKIGTKRNSLLNFFPRINQPHHNMQSDFNNMFQITNTQDVCVKNTTAPTTSHMDSKSKLKLNDVTSNNIYQKQRIPSKNEKLCSMQQSRIESDTYSKNKQQRISHSVIRSVPQTQSHQSKQNILQLKQQNNYASLNTSWDETILKKPASHILLQNTVQPNKIWEDLEKMNQLNNLSSNDTMTQNNVVKTNKENHM